VKRVKLASLDPDMRAACEVVGFRLEAWRDTVDVPARGQSPARRGKALLCRLYPNATDTRAAFAKEQQLYAEAVVFEDPDDVLAWNLKAGFENALYAAAQIMRPAKP
jgi:hypothetical protein